MLRRNILGGIDRATWDPLHKAVLRYKSKKAEWVDKNGIRYYVFHRGEKRIKAYAKVPTTAQRLTGCNTCMGQQHLASNKTCFVNNKKRIRFGPRDAIYNIKTHEMLSLPWVRSVYEQAPKYKSAYAEFSRL